MKGLMTPFGDLVMVRHRLKTWPDVYQEIEDGRKVHEFRKNDRDYQTGDIILLEEFVPAGDRYTGRSMVVQAMSISYGPEWGIPEGYAVFSIRKLTGLIVDISDPEGLDS